MQSLGLAEALTCSTVGLDGAHSFAMWWLGLRMA